MSGAILVRGHPSVSTTEDTRQAMYLLWSYSGPGYSRVTVLRTHSPESFRDRGLYYPLSFRSPSDELWVLRTVAKEGILKPLDLRYKINTH